jgi:hypothetical protein
LDERGRRQQRHNLPKLWRRYKRARNNPALDRFDQTIADVHKFERIRYPEEILRSGLLAEIGFIRNPRDMGVGPRPPGERYEMALDEVDELVKLIFEIENINPPFFLNKLNEHARRYLDHQNSFRCNQAHTVLAPRGQVAYSLTKPTLRSHWGPKYNEIPWPPKRTHCLI